MSTSEQQRDASHGAELRFDGVRKTWPDGTVAVDRVDLHVPAGQFCVILGSSGAGKSTLLGMVNGQVDATSGYVAIDESLVDRANLTAMQRQSAMVHQQFNLVGRLTVLKNVLTGILPRLGWVRAMLALFPASEKRRACQWLARVGLSEEHLYRRAEALSGGQQQRVAIARAFFSQPRILLADEPVASLDPKTSVDILSLLKDTASREGTTVLCSLHQVELARQFADRLVAMSDGRVVFDGAPSELDARTLRTIYHKDEPTAEGQSERSTEEEPPMSRPAPGPPRRPVADPVAWQLRGEFGWRTIGSVVLVALLLLVSSFHTGIGRGVRQTVGAVTSGVASLVGVEYRSKVGSGLIRFVEKAFPPVIERVRPIKLLGKGFDLEDDRPWLSYVETREKRNMVGQVIGEQQYLVEPIGYLVYVLGLMVKTIEIAIWGTLLALMLAVPLAYWGAANYTPSPAFYWLGRGLCSLSRAMPELILALLFVVMFGIGPFAGVLALGFHCAGFLGKFFADDAENAPRGPQHALRSAGASKTKVIRFAILPQILPQVFAYLQYILERNVRSATVLGIVGAGGIGLELIGQWDLYQYGHAMTILIVIFVTVIVLELATQRLRGRLI